jgi:YkoY family integral membrane protein
MQGLELYDWNHILADFSQIADNPVPSIILVLNLILIESLLSVDNAAVLATMVLGLNKDDRRKALRYGILGAYFFRGICLIFATVLLSFWWLKAVGGLYLLYLVFIWYRKKLNHKNSENEAIDTKQNWLYKHTVNRLGIFWATVVAVEVMDLAFSIDNVFAAAAMSKNVVLIWTGVFIGILAMRFVAQGFVTLMEKFPFLETCAYIVLLILGLRLMLAIPEHIYPDSEYNRMMTGHQADWMFSGLTFAIFLMPILWSILYNRTFQSKNNKN